LKTVVPLLSNQSVFLYLDPFGLAGDFAAIEPFLKRPKQYSTEILVNLQAPVHHRLAARDALRSGTGDPQQIATWHNTLTRALVDNQVGLER
jgi:hypothetical protein